MYVCCFSQLCRFFWLFLFVQFDVVRKKNHKQHKCHKQEDITFNIHTSTLDHIIYHKRNQTTHQSIMININHQFHRHFFLFIVELELLTNIRERFSFNHLTPHSKRQKKKQFNWMMIPKKNFYISVTMHKTTHIF